MTIERKKISSKYQTKNEITSILFTNAFSPKIKQVQSQMLK